MVFYITNDTEYEKDQKLKFYQILVIFNIINLTKQLTRSYKKLTFVTYN